MLFLLFASHHFDFNDSQRDIIIKILLTLFQLNVYLGFISFYTHLSKSSTRYSSHLDTAKFVLVMSWSAC
jgi:hypothetical protein